MLKKPKLTDGELANVSFDMWSPSRCSSVKLPGPRVDNILDGFVSCFLSTSYFLNSV